MTLVVKLGGSVVTEKDRRETVDEAALGAAAEALSDVTEPLVVVHGGGSFGHPAAAEYGLSETDGTQDPEGILAVHRAMARLNERVVDALVDVGLSPVPVHPLSMASRDEDADLDVSTMAIERAIAEGLVPVVQADMIAHEGDGATVISGDELVPVVARAVDANRVGVCSTVPGVLDASGGVVESIDSEGAIPDAVGGSDATDVTGGMAGKIRRLLELDVPAHVFGPDALAAFVAGERPGTQVGGR